jgi:hypothetical protein
MLRDGNCGLPRFDGLDVHRALLLGHPAFVDQRLVAAPCHPREFVAGLCLIERRFELFERRLVLRNLGVEFRYCELRQQIAGLDAIADIDVALGDVAGRAGIDARGSEGGGGAGQTDRNGSGARLDCRDTQGGHEIALLLCSGRDFLPLRIISPGAHRESGGEH